MNSVVLLLLLRLSTLLHALRLAVALTSNETAAADRNASCTPARCGELNISYPFTLGGAQPFECGFPAFNLTCDAAAGRAYLSRTLRDRMYHVKEIFYDNSSLVVAVETSFSGDESETCRIPDFNISSSLALFPLNVSKQNNRDLTFVYNCVVPPSVQLPGKKCANRTMGVYFSDNTEARNGTSNCSYVSVPARTFREKLQARDYYVQMIRDGFLLEWPPLEDCEACRRRGGECRFVDLTFKCICSEGQPCQTQRSRGGDREALAIKIGSGIAAGLVCLLILCAVSLVTLHKRRRKRSKRSASLVGLIRETGTASPLASLKKEFGTTGSPRTHIFTYEELDEATDGFSDARELGVGGFGTVYKGTLLDGSVVAVKRLYKNSYKGVEQFLNEVDILSRLRHPNLVTLYGCTAAQGSSSRDHDLLLVYEFVPNGTLADHLHGNKQQQHTQPLSWRTRLGVAVETASALDYLHSVEPHQVVHRDVKTSNILLNEAFHVKVADFGLSRLFPADATHVSTAPQGTPGYVDPAYHQRYQLTDKSDVYSFGVVLVELISSRPAVDMSRAGGGGDVNLATIAVHMIQSYEIDRLVDPRLGYGTDDATRRTVDLVAEAAFRCLQPEQDVRPPIREVLDVLREAQRMMEQQEATRRVSSVDGDVDVGSLKKNRDGSPDSVMYEWISPSTTANNSS